jgi:hypothetical protein
MAFQQPQRPERVGIRSVLWRLEADLDMTLGGQVINFGGLGVLDDTDEIRCIGHIAVMQHEPNILFVRIVIKMINTLRIEGRGAALDAVDNVPFAEEEFGKVSAVLAGGTGYESDFV